MDILRHNRDAWDRQVEKGNEWTRPVGPDEVARARRGDWKIILTPTRPVPRDWFPATLDGVSVLCLAGGGGQQGPILAAAGASVTVFDLSPNQLAQDRAVAAREGLTIEAVEGDMRDLRRFPDGRFDLIVHPCSNHCVDDVSAVWREAFRVLKRGGALLAGFTNPLLYLIDPALEEKGVLQIRYRVPFSTAEQMGEAEVRRLADAGEPLEFGHTLEQLIGGQTAAGFVIAGFYEDTGGGRYPIDDHSASFIVTRAVKP